MNDNQALPHQLILSDRRLLTVTGVADVDTFDDTVAVLETSLGMLTVKGSSLQVKHLNVETGDLSLEGHIDTMEYAPTPMPRGHFFKRIFR